MLDTPIFTRQTAREDLNVTTVTFGMMLPVARQIASLSLSQVKNIAYANTEYLRVRWSESPGALA